MSHARLWIVAWILLLGGCGQTGDESPAGTLGVSSPMDVTASNPLRNAYFGDLHVHTTNSFDAYGVGVRATPDDAYRYAKGEAVKHPLGYSVRLRGGPLDFYGVTDHAENLGLGAAFADPGNPLAAHPLVKKYHSNDPKEHQAARLGLGSPQLTGKPVPDLNVIPVISAT